MIDFHSHIIPQVDDGAQSPEIALEMVLDSKAQGVGLIVATPHYYLSEGSVDAFTEKRNEGFEKLRDIMAKEGTDGIRFRLGAEVLLNYGISGCENFEKLAIEGTNAILLEMPYDDWQNWAYNEVFKIMNMYSLIPVMAHVERYIHNRFSLGKLQKLIDMGVYIQINAASLCDWRSRGTIKWIMKNAPRIVLGSDMHNMGAKRSLIEKAKTKIIKKYGNAAFCEMQDNAMELLGL